MSNDELSDARKYKAGLAFTRFRFGDGSSASDVIEKWSHIERLFSGSQSPFACNGDIYTLNMRGINAATNLPVNLQFVIQFTPGTAHIKNAVFYVDGSPVGYDMSEFTVQQRIDNLLSEVHGMKEQCRDLEWFARCSPELLIKDDELRKYKRILSDPYNRSATASLNDPTKREWMIGFIAGIGIACDLAIDMLAKEYNENDEDFILDEYLTSNMLNQAKYECFSQLGMLEGWHYDAEEVIQMVNYLSEAFQEEYERLEYDEREHTAMIGEANGILATLRLHYALVGLFPTDVTQGYHEWPNYYTPPLVNGY